MEDSTIGSIPKRPFGQICNNTKLPETVSIVGLGCSSFSSFFFTDEELGDGADSWSVQSLKRTHPRVQEWIRTIEYAVLEADITVLDTAPWYGHGTSETVIGWAIEQLGENKNFRRSSVSINTKIGRYEAEPTRMFDFTAYTTLQSVARSLKRMNIDYVDVLQLHDPEFAPSLEELFNETIPALLVCQERGWCRALGLTGYPLRVQHQILELSLEQYGRNIFDQSLTYGHYNLHNFSLFDRPIAHDTPSFAEYCLERDIMILAAAPLSMGLLTRNVLPDWHPASPELQQACEHAGEVCQRHNVNIATLALVVALANPRIPCTVVGMRNVEQVQAVQSVASRFRGVPAGMTVDEILESVLVDNEKLAWKQLSDSEQGPFATVWKSGAFRWNGIEEARKFWKRLGKDVCWPCTND